MLKIGMKFISKFRWLIAAFSHGKKGRSPEEDKQIKEDNESLFRYLSFK